MRKVRYINALGQDIFFDNRSKLFCEKMEIFSTPARSTSQALAMGYGNVSSDFGYDAKPMRFSFAYRSVGDDAQMREYIGAVFTPTAPGEIVIYTDDGEEYRIKARLAAVPEFIRAARRKITWDAEFIADYPFFSKGRRPQEVTLAAARTIINNRSPVKVPVTVTMQGSLRIENETTGAGFWITVPEGETVTVDTETFSVRNGNGENVSHYLGAENDIGDFGLAPGNNSIFCTGDGAIGTVIRWKEKRSGLF